MTALAGRKAGHFAAAARGPLSQAAGALLLPLHSFIYHSSYSIHRRCWEGGEEERGQQDTGGL